MLPASHDCLQWLILGQGATAALEAFTSTHNRFQEGFDLLSLVEGWDSRVRAFWESIPEMSGTGDAGRLLCKKYLRPD